MRKRVHIIYRGGRWALKKDGGKRATLICDTVRECVLETVPMRSMGWEVILHKKDGTVREIIKDFSSEEFAEWAYAVGVRGLDA